MAGNAIYWQNKALRQLRKIPPEDAQRIRSAVGTELTDLSKARNVRALTGHDCGYRLRVGQWRILFDFDGQIRVISIEEVVKRDERTY